MSQKYEKEQTAALPKWSIQNFLVDNGVGLSNTKSWLCVIPDIFTVYFSCSSVLYNDRKSEFFYFKTMGWNIWGWGRRGFLLFLHFTDYNFVGSFYQKYNIEEPTGSSRAFKIWSSLEQQLQGTELQDPGREAWEAQDWILVFYKEDYIINNYVSHTALSSLHVPSFSHSHGSIWHWSLLSQSFYL